MQMGMQGHARILEKYADLQENHFALLARRQKMQEGIENVKRAASKAGVRGVESKFINSLAIEISALKVDREKKEGTCWMRRRGCRLNCEIPLKLYKQLVNSLCSLRKQKKLSLFSRKEL